MYIIYLKKAKKTDNDNFENRKEIIEVLYGNIRFTLEMLKIANKVLCNYNII